MLFAACRSATPSLSEEELNKFCISIEAALNDRNVEFLDALYDKTYLVELVTEGISAPEYYKEGFEEGFDKYYTPGTIMTASLDEFAYVKFLRVKQKGKNPIGLFRTVTDDGVNYIEVMLGSDEEGVPIIKDFYSYKEAEMFSQGIKRLYLINLANEQGDINHPLVQALPTINQAAQLADAGMPERGFATLQKLPKEVFKQKIVLLMLLTMGQDAGADSMLVAEKIFQKHYPDDPLLELKKMEFGFLKRDTANIVRYIDALHQKIGGDPYLSILKAAILKNRGETSEAESLLTQALKAEPENDEGYWLMIDLLIKEKRYPEVIELFQTFKDNLEDNPADYIINDGYDDFYASPEFIAWTDKHPIQTQKLDFNLDSLMRALDAEGKTHHHGPGGHDHHDHHGHHHH